MNHLGPAQWPLTSSPFPPFTNSLTFPDCTNGPLSQNLICNASATPEHRVNALLDLFTVDELIQNTINSSPGVPRLGLPSYQWWSEALHGVASSPGISFSEEGDFSYATSFPQPILMSAAFDDDLIYQVATVVSTELRAFSNVGRSGLDFWTPNINPFRDPRWGRGQETPGEDAFRTANYAYHVVTGLQGGRDPQPYLKTITTCKHYAAYDVEDWLGHDRYSFDAVVSLQDMAEYYMPPFQACIRDAKGASAMCSYNAVNGVPACADPYLLQTILRDHWGLEGWVVSDCDAIWDVFVNHHYGKTFPEAVAISLQAGTDLDCGYTYASELPNAFDQSLISKKDLKLALSRLYGSLIRVGYFDPPSIQPYRQLTWNDVNTPDAQALAFRAAADGMVLLKNDGTLPLKSSIKTIAIIGPLGNATTEMQANYAGVAPYLISPLQGAVNAGYNATFVEGTTISFVDTSGFDAAIRAAQKADAIVYAGGIDNSIEGESRDRVEITWPGNQLDLIEKLSQLQKPLIVLQFGGGQVDDTPLIGNDGVGAILWTGYPGQSGGDAIFSILNGSVAPAGRLPSTQFPANYTSLAMTDMSLRPSDTSPGQTYRFYNGTPVFEFGFGLHYTTFSASWFHAPPLTMDISSFVSHGIEESLPFALFSVLIANTGKVQSDYVALLFVNGTFGPGPYPKKQLVSYSRAKAIAPGAKTRVNLPVTLASVARADARGNTWLYPGKYQFTVDTPGVLSAVVILKGTPVQLTSWPQKNATSV